jgi:hypothetical protein
MDAIALGSAPTTAQDTSAGYGVGSVVQHGGVMYRCYDATNGAAVWRVIPGIETGSFAFTLTGFTANPSGTMLYTKIGKRVMLYLNAGVTATSNTTGMACAAGTVPAGIRPSQSRFPLTIVSDNGNAILGATQINTDGSMNFYRQIQATGEISTSGFTNSGTKGLGLAFNAIYEMD